MDHHLGNYIWGFVLSIALTLAAYFTVTLQLFDSDLIKFSIVLMAIGQAFVQLFLFLHLGEEAKPRWRLYVFFNMLMIVCILVGGTLWIMSHLNYNMMGH